MPTYFGNQTKTDAYDWGSSLAVWNAGYTCTCPGIGDQIIKELSVFAEGTSCNIRCAIYSSDGTTKIAEGSGEVPLSTTPFAWYGHGPGLYNALSPSAPVITGGQNYILCVSCDGTTYAYGIDAGSSGAFKYSTNDYTGGWPASLPSGGNPGNYNFCIRCGVDAAAGTLSIQMSECVSSFANLG